MSESKLLELQRRLGATFETYRGIESAAHYGDPNTESEILRSAGGLVLRSWATGVEMLGADRARFLGGYVTCDVKDLEPGQGVYGFVTSVKGRILADPVVLALEDRLWLELPPGTSEEIAQHLSKYVIVDRVEIQPLAAWHSLSLIGPESIALLAAAGVDEAQLPPATWSHLATEAFGQEVRLVREPSYEVGGQEIPALTLWVPAESVSAHLEQWLDAVGNLIPVGHQAFETLRIEAGRPLFGVDFSSDYFPQETGLGEQTVSYTKGCYLGQEVVARIHYRGGVNRHLRGLRFDDGSGDSVGQAVLVDGREAGTVSSAATLASGERIGLAILHKRAEPGASVEIADSGSAQVVELPFS